MIKSNCLSSLKNQYQTISLILSYLEKRWQIWHFNIKSIKNILMILINNREM